MLHINVEKKLGNLTLSANLNIPSKGVTALFGLSGSGKSSLINLISGLINPDYGQISLNQRALFDSEQHICIPTHQRNIGYVFQDARLFPHYSVKGNLRYGIGKVSKAEFDYIVELLGIGHLLKRSPVTLSGGEKQRVAIGRALLTNPEILLMDEPLSALDLPRKRELMAYLETLAQEINIPILYVTHSLDELVRLAERVVLLENGSVRAYDRLETIWQSPLFESWKGKKEQSTVWRLPVHLHHPVYQMSALQIGEQLLWINQTSTAIGDFQRVLIYSTDVSISLQKPQQTSIRNILQGKILRLCSQKNRVDVEVQIAEQCLWASVSAWSAKELNLQQGQNVFLQIKAVSVG